MGLRRGRSALRAHQLDAAQDVALPDSSGAAASEAGAARRAAVPKSAWQTLTSPLAKAVLVSTASSVLSGYDQGVIAAAMLTMKSELQLSDVEEEMSIGVMNIAAAGGGLLAGVAAEMLGRRKAIALANLFFLAGSLAIALAPSFAMLFCGRLLQGVGVGFALVVAPIFTAELVPSDVRGRLVSLGDVCTNGGILLGYSAGLVFLHTPAGWRYMFWLGCAPALLIVGFIFSAPESPRWLVSVGRIDEARRVVHRLVEDEAEAATSLDEMVAAVAALKLQPKSGWGDVIRHPDPVVRGMVWRGLAIALFSQLTGTEAVVYYAGDIVQQAGISSMRDTLLAIMAVGLCKLVFLLFASALFDRVGRRPMLLASAAGLTGSLLVLASATLGETRRPVLAISGLCAYMASFSIGFSPLVYVVCSELFPLGVRARAMSCALFVTRVTAGVISSVFVTLRDVLTPTGAWLIFVPVAVGAFAFVYAYIPETNGLGLEGVQAMFAAMEERKAARRARKAARRAERRGARRKGGAVGAGGGDVGALPAARGLELHEVGMSEAGRPEVGPRAAGPAAAGGGGAAGDGGALAPGVAPDGAAPDGVAPRGCYSASQAAWLGAAPGRATSDGACPPRPADGHAHGCGDGAARAPDGREHEDNDRGLHGRAGATWRGAGAPAGAAE